MNVYYIKGGITLRGTLVWSATQKNDHEALWVSFFNGNVQGDNFNSKVLLHALCVRNYQPATDGVDTP